MLRIEGARENGAMILDLSGLELSALPEAIGQLSQLQVRDLSGNQLSTLPEAVQRLQKLERLFLHDNPGLGLPDDGAWPIKELGPEGFEMGGEKTCWKQATPIFPSVAASVKAWLPSF